MRNEVDFGKTVSIASDIYSFGSVTYELLTRKSPYEGLTDFQLIQSSIVSGQRPQLPDMVRRQHPLLVEIMDTCWQQNPEARFPNFATIMNLLDPRRKSSAQTLFKTITAGTTMPNLDIIQEQE